MILIDDGIVCLVCAVLWEPYAQFGLQGTALQCHTCRAFLKTKSKKFQKNTERMQRIGEQEGGLPYVFAAFLPPLTEGYSYGL